MEAAIKVGKSRSPVFTEYRLADEVDCRGQQQDSAKEQAQEKCKFP